MCASRRDEDSMGVVEPMPLSLGADGGVGRQIMSERGCKERVGCHGGSQMRVSERC